MDVVEHALSEPQGVLVEPAGGSATGVLVLAGSSGRIDTERCRVLARAGLTALSIRWFGGPGQPPGICEVPLETFVAAVDLLLAKGMQRIGALGLSKGAEAALLLAIRDPRIDAVVALSPTSVVWANVGPGTDGVAFPYRSSWTWRGEPLPFVPYADRTSIEAARTPTAYRANYERSREMYAQAARQAVIPIEEATAEIVLVAGGDDQMWPSLTFARELAARRPVRLIADAGAGHRPRLPGEGPAALTDRYDYGGTAEADAALGALAWPDIMAALTGIRR